MWLVSQNEFLCAATPRFLVAWGRGQKETDIITIMEGGSVRCNVSWKYTFEGRSDVNDRELHNALAQMRFTNPKVQSCLACEHGIYVRLGRKHTVEFRQTIHPLS